MPLDHADALLLQALQKDGRLTSQELAEVTNLSPSQCARRRQRLEEAGIIGGYRATVDPARLGIAIVAFMRIFMASHSRENAVAFQKLVAATPEILDAWALTGETDYLLRVAVPDLKALNGLVQEVLLPHPVVARVQSQIVMAELKANAPLPVVPRQARKPAREV
jgi:DNA-binding Lrp family transcriptional regulator